MLLHVFAAAAMGYFSGSHKHEDKAIGASHTCAERLGHALGANWTTCIIDELLAQQAAAQKEGRDDYFPIAPHDPVPFKAKRSFGMKAAAVTTTSELLKNLMRNVSCDIEDGGTQPLRSMTWEYLPPDPCANVDAAAKVSQYKPGFLPAGDDLPEMQGPMSEKDAVERCEAEPRCAGFTFSSASRDHDLEPTGAVHTMLFKGQAVEVTPADGWHSFKKRKSVSQCKPGMRAPPPMPEQFRVDVLRDSPPIYVVHDFASEEECEHMVGSTLPKMTRSVVFGGGAKGGASSYRQSYSVNMVPDFDDEVAPVTKLARRKFAFAREVAEYSELVEGDGQEPINAVYYKDWEDQYRPHCDGECNGGRYSPGRRIATSLTYCAVADKGGYTMFTRSAIKVVPKARQMLFFGYKINGRAHMDDGLTEHTGCPLREGRKWIATQWYREGMTAEKGWDAYRA